MQILDY